MDIQASNAKHLEWYSSKAKLIMSKSIEVEIDNEEKIIYIYCTAFHGGVTKLSQEEAEKLKAGHDVEPFSLKQSISYML